MPCCIFFYNIRSDIGSPELKFAEIIAMQLPVAGIRYCHDADYLPASPFFVINQI
jgi:hypothetical protein